MDGWMDGWIGGHFQEIITRVLVVQKYHYSEYSWRVLGVLYLYNNSLRKKKKSLRKKKALINEKKMVTKIIQKFQNFEVGDD